VEMAIVLPLLLVLGGLDYTLQLHVLHCMTNASRVAARVLAVREGTIEAATSATIGINCSRYS
jgi:Flp pilus assembly protein TadG